MKKVKTLAVVREADWTDRETGKTKKIQQNLVDIVPEYPILGISNVLLFLTQVCKVVYPLKNSLVSEITEAISWGDLVAQFKEFAERAPRDAENAPTIVVEEDSLSYETASKTAIVRIFRLHGALYESTAAVWQTAKAVSPLLNAAKEQGLIAKVRREPVEEIA